MGLEQLDEKVYSLTMPSQDKVEIGDIKVTNFKPQIKLNRWDGECYLKVSLPVAEDSLPIISGDTIIWEGRDKHIKMYPQSSKQFELGSYEYEIVLEKKPASNKVALDMETRNLKFLYQAPLTPQEIEWGRVRPLNIEGSYAVYHATKGVLNVAGGKDYKAGKAFHIPRPKIVDDNGDWVWGGLLIDSILGKQIITIPLDFYNSAKYPIRHAAGDTFGYTTIGGSIESANSADEIIGYRHTTPADCTSVDSITAYGEGWPGPSLFKGLVVNLAEAILTNGIGAASGSAWEDETPAWKTSAFGTPPTVSSSTDYFLCIIVDDDYAIYYDGGTEDYQIYDGSNSYASPVNPTGASYFDTKYSIYATYTPAGAPGVVPQAYMHLQRMRRQG